MSAGWLAARLRSYDASSRDACPAVGGPETGGRMARRHAEGHLLRDILSEKTDSSVKFAAACYSLQARLRPCLRRPLRCDQRVPDISSRSSTTRCPRTQAAWGSPSSAKAPLRRHSAGPAAQHIVIQKFDPIATEFHIRILMRATASPRACTRTTSWRPRPPSRKGSVRAIWALGHVFKIDVVDAVAGRLGSRSRVAYRGYGELL